MHTLASHVWHVNNRGCSKLLVLRIRWKLCAQDDEFWIISALQVPYVDNSLVCRIWRAVPRARKSSFCPIPKWIDGRKRGLSRVICFTNSTHGVWNSFSIYFLSGVYILLSPIWNFQIGTSEILPRTTNIWWIRIFTLIEYEILEKSYKELKMELKGTRCKIPVLPYTRCLLYTSPSPRD